MTTRTSRSFKQRKGVLSLLLADFPLLQADQRAMAQMKYWTKCSPLTGSDHRVPTLKIPLQKSKNHCINSTVADRIMPGSWMGLHPQGYEQCGQRGTHDSHAHHWRTGCCSLTAGNVKPPLKELFFPSWNGELWKNCAVCPV